MKFIYFFLFLILLSACSSIRPINRNKIEMGTSAVDMDLNTENSNEKNQNEAIKIEKPIDTIRIGENSGEVFESKLVNPNDSNQIKPIKIALSLGPGLNRTINYISMLKVLEKNKLTPAVITGNEMGAVIAGLYASGVTPELIEWMFFKYFKSKKTYKTYEKDWIAEIDEYFLTKIKTIQIENTKIKFYLTLYDQSSQKVLFFDKGNMRELLLLSLRTRSNPMKYKSGEIYSGAFEKEVFNQKLIMNHGGEFLIAADSLVNQVEFDNTNEYLYGLLGAVAAKTNLEKKSFDFVFNLPEKFLKLDSIKNVNESLQASESYTNRQLNLLKKKIKEKVDFLNSKNEIRE